MSQAPGRRTKRVSLGGRGESTPKAIRQALHTLRPGDTLELAAGTYHEKIVIPFDDICVRAKTPGVVLDGSATLPPSAFRHARNRPGVFVWPLPEGSSATIPWVLYNGEMLVCRIESLSGTGDEMCFHADTTRRRVEVNINGKNIPSNAIIVVPIIGPLIDINKRSGVRICGLELTLSAGDAIDAMGSERLRVEYCHIHHAGGTGIRGGHKACYARNTIAHCNECAVWQGDGNDESLIEENLVVANALTWDPNEHWAGNLKQNNASRCVYRQNWVMDHTPGPVKVGPQTRIFSHCFATGIWPDINCNNNAYEGNALARLPHAGLYIEHTADRNTALYNCVQDCGMGVTLRQASANLVARNWVFNREFFGWGKNQVARYAAFGRGFDANGKPITQAEESAMWGRQLFEGLCLWHAYDDFQEASTYNSVHSNLIQVSGRAVSVPLHTYDWPNESQRAQTPPPRVLTNRFDGNYYDRPADDGDFALLGKTPLKNFDEYRRAANWDANARSGRFTAAVLGLEPIWTMPWAAKLPDVPVAILHDPTLQTRSATSIDEPMFWHGSHPQRDWINTPPQSRWDRNNPEGRNGRGLMFLESTPRHKGREFTQAVNWRSSAIPVKPGITMGLKLWMKARDVKPASEGCGVRVAIRFLDALGFLIERKELVGGQTRSDLVAGSYDWTELSGSAKVPDGGCWMTVVLALEPAEGMVSFDDIHINLVNPPPPDVSQRARH